MQKALIAACFVGTALSAGAAEQTAYLLYESPPVSVAYDDTFLEGSCFLTCDFNILASENGATSGWMSLRFSSAAPTLGSKFAYSTYVYENFVPGATQLTAGELKYWIRAFNYYNGDPLWQSEATLGTQEWANVARSAAVSNLLVNVEWLYVPGTYTLAGSSKAHSYELQRATFVSAVPEPASYALMAAGVAILGMAVRRRTSSGRPHQGR